MKLKYRGISYDYNPPKVTYADSSVASAIKEQVRLLAIADQERAENRQRSMLMRALHKAGPDLDVSERSDHVAFS